MDINGNLWKILLGIAGVILAAGIYCATIISNTNRIEKVEIKTNKTEVEFVEFRAQVKTSLMNIEKGIQRIEKKIE